MYYQSQDIRGSTLAISESLKYRKTCIFENITSKKSNTINENNENYSPLFQRQVRINSMESKKQSRRKTGSIGKIVRNNHSNEKSNGFQERAPLTEANNFLNQKLQYQKDNENVGIYKKVYEQNKLLNEALKSKIYQTPQSSSYKNSLIDMSNYRPESKTFTKTFNTNNFVDEKMFLQSKERLNSKKNDLDVKYQSMLAQYDKKKIFVKQEMLAMKQKTSLDNFSNEKNKVPQISSKLSYQYNSRENNNSFKNPQKIDLQKVNNKSQSLAKTITSSFSQNIKPTTYQSIHNETQSQIDSKFKAYQQKVQKHKEFEKRNSSVNKYSQLLSAQKQKSSIDTNTLKSSSLSQQIKIYDKPSIKNSQSSSIKIFSDLLMKQIQKDQQIRVIKNNLKNFSIQEVQNILKQRYSFNIDCQTLKLSTQEYDPFFQSKQCQKSVDKFAWSLFNAFQIAQNFWKNLIVGRFSQQELQKIYDTINASKKNNIELNEFTREISFYSNKTIRGRQIFSSYRRLVPLTRQNFITKLSKRQ